MRIETMGLLLTGAGIIFCAISLAIIILGKKVGRQGGPQTVKVGKFEVSTNAAIMLVIITGCFALAPYALTYMDPNLTNYISRDEVDEKYLPIDDLAIYVHGYVMHDGGIYADSVEIEVIRTNDLLADTAFFKTDMQGGFDVTLSKVKPEEKYTFTWTKPGYTPEMLRFGFNKITSNLTLKRSGGD